jgi:hypothetical protein
MQSDTGVSFEELLKEIDGQQITSILTTNGYTQWSYFIVPLEGVVGIVCANSTQLAIYCLSDENILKLGPLGVLPAAHTYLESRKDTYTLRIVDVGNKLDQELLVLDDINSVRGSDYYGSNILQKWTDWAAAHGNQGQAVNTSMPTGANNVAAKYVNEDGTTALRIQNWKYLSLQQKTTIVLACVFATFIIITSISSLF